MKVTLKNVGVIKDSTIIINGITLITGKNNSGKSTFGKAVYALISSTENLYKNATEDTIQFVESMLTKRLRSNDLHLICRGTMISRDESVDIFRDERYTILREIYNQKYPSLNSLDDLKDYIEFVSNIIRSIDEQFIKEIMEVNRLAKLRGLDVIKELDSIKNEFILNCKEVVDLIDEYSDFSEYEQKKVLLTLLKEFNNQISPVKIQNELVSEFIIENGEKKYSFKIFEKEHEYTDDGELLFNEDNNVIFIDDVTVVDSVCPGFSARKFYTENENIEDYINCYDHKSSLIRKLIKQDDIMKSIINDENYSKIEDKINSVMQDEIVIKDGKFVCSSDSLDLANLAMGSKLFAILKMLIKNGSIDNNTVLILDEPEAHLHPERQNILAEIIAILVKEIGLRIIITSHSPNFVLAIQTYSEKYGLGDKTNYYTTNKIDGYQIKYNRVNDNLSVIYSDFAKYFSEIKALYDSLIYGEFND